jgi:hypothetical protein
MKKTIMVLAILATLASCNSSSNEVPPVDSVTVDSTVVVDSVLVADSSVGALQGGGGTSPEMLPPAKDEELVDPTKREVIK